MPKQKDLSLYDERYKTLYENGVTFWNEHQPNQLLIDLLNKLSPNADCIDLGCGEGFEVRALAEKGFNVTGVDLSPTVIKKAKNVTPSELNISFLCGDVTDLKGIGIEDNSFDLVTNIGCLHMMQNEEDRKAHLNEVKRILRPNGYFYLQNGLDPDDVNPRTLEEINVIKEIKKITSDYQPGKRIPRKIITNEGEKEILLPLCPNGKTLSLDNYIIELESVGFKIVKTERSGGANMPFEAIIIAKK